MELYAAAFVVHALTAQFGSGLGPIPGEERFQNLADPEQLTGLPESARALALQTAEREGVDGWLVPCEDTSALRDAFRDAFADPDRLAAMGRSARERIETDFTVQREADALVAFYRSMQQQQIA